MTSLQLEQERCSNRHMQPCVRCDVAVAAGQWRDSERSDQRKEANMIQSKKMENTSKITEEIIHTTTHCKQTRNTM